MSVLIARSVQVVNENDLIVWVVMIQVEVVDLLTFPLCSILTNSKRLREDLRCVRIVFVLEQVLNHQKHKILIVEVDE